MLYGPYGVAEYGLKISSAFSMDTEGIDTSAKDGNMNTVSIKEEKRKEDNQSR